MPCWHDRPECSELGGMLKVMQRGALLGQSVHDLTVLGVGAAQHQRRVVTHLPQVQQRLQHKCR